MLNDEDRKWLTALDAELWPPKEKKGTTITLEAERPLTHVEFKRICTLIEDHGLLTSMFCTSMFGGYGMDVYEHEPFPGTGPTHLLRLVEDHMPVPHPVLVIEEGYDKHIRPGGGVGRTDAWESFSRFTHSEQNAAWLKSYKMDPPQPRGHYDY